MKKVVTLRLALYVCKETGAYFTTNAFANDDEIYTNSLAGSSFVKFVYVTTEVDE